MSDGTKIEWADATVNAINGCSVTSPGCTNCYAMRLAGTRMQHHPTRAGLTQPSKAGPVWTGEVRLNEAALLQPLSWKRPRRIFWNAHGDLFHDAVPDEWIDRVFAVCALTPQHKHMILTKRSARMRDYVSQRLMIGAGVILKMGFMSALSVDDRCKALLGIDQDTPTDQARPLPNVWLGVSVEDQARADERIPDLLATPAAVRFISAEPLLGPVDMAWALSRDPCRIAAGFLSRGQFAPGMETLRKLDWVIAGGESGPCARPMHPGWTRSLRDQCAAAGVAFHFKQWGEWVPALDGNRCIDAQGRNMPNLEPGGSNGDGTTRIRRVGKKAAGRLLDGRTHDVFPA